MVWDHLFGVHLTLRNGLQGSFGKLGALYRSALRLSIAVPMNIRGAALYLPCHTILLYKLITILTVGYFAHLEDKMQ